MNDDSWLLTHYSYCIRGVWAKICLVGYDSKLEMGWFMNNDSLIAALCNARWVFFANAKTYLIYILSTLIYSLTYILTITEMKNIAERVPNIGSINSWFSESSILDSALKLRATPFMIVRVICHWWTKYMTSLPIHRQVTRCLWNILERKIFVIGKHYLVSPNGKSRWWDLSKAQLTGSPSWEWSDICTWYITRWKLGQAEK